MPRVVPVMFWDLVYDTLLLSACIYTLRHFKLRWKDSKDGTVGKCGSRGHRCIAGAVMGACMLEHSTGRWLLTLCNYEYFKLEDSVRYWISSQCVRVGRSSTASQGLRPGNIGMLPSEFVTKDNALVKTDDWKAGSLSTRW